MCFSFLVFLVLFIFTGGLQKNKAVCYHTKSKRVQVTSFSRLTSLEAPEEVASEFGIPNASVQKPWKWKASHEKPLLVFARESNGCQRFWTVRNGSHNHPQYGGVSLVSGGRFITFGSGNSPITGGCFIFGEVGEDRFKWLQDFPELADMLRMQLERADYTEGFLLTHNMGEDSHRHPNRLSSMFFVVVIYGPVFRVATPPPPPPDGMGPPGPPAPATREPEPPDPGTYGPTLTPTP